MSGDYEAALARYRALVGDVMGESVKGKANPYTSMNGNMFSFLAKDGTICLRLSDSDREAYLARFGGAPVMQYGAVMRGYVAVTAACLEDGAALEEVAQKCLSHARTLKPKPAKSRKKT